MSTPFCEFRFFSRRVILGFAALALLSCGAPLRAANAISWGAVTLPAVGFAGSNISFTATVTNTGNTTWDSSYFLQLADAAGNHLYLPSVAGIPPGGTSPPVTFYLTLPSVPGTYTYGLSAVQHNVTYFGAQQTRSIVVSNLPPATVNPPDGQSVVWLSSYGFLNVAAPKIDTNWAAATPPTSTKYRLRAKFPYPGMSGDWHAATLTENKGKDLDDLPPPNLYSPVSLYWLRYNDAYVLQEIGPFTSRAVTIADPAVLLSSYWFHESTRPTVTINQTLPKNYRLVVRLVGGVPNADLAMSMNNSTRFLDRIPGPGEYTVEIFWEKYNDAGTAVIATQPPPYLVKTITITAGAIPVLKATGGIWGDDVYDEDGNQTGTNYSCDFYVLYVPMAGQLRLYTGGDNTALRVTYVREGGNWWSDLNSTPGLAIDATFSVLPGVYYLSVDGDATGSYQISADLTPPPPPVVTNTSLPPATVGVPYGPVQITTTPAATIFTAAGLPPGLTISSAGGLISGTPTQATPAGTVGNVLVYAANGGGHGPSKTLTLVVGIPPTITTQPSNTITAVGGSVTFSVAASGTSPMSYQWSKNGAHLTNGGAVGGATSPTLTLSGITAADGANYSVVVTNLCGTKTSRNGILIVGSNPLIDSNGNSFSDAAEINLGARANLAGTATTGGTPPSGWSSVALGSVTNTLAVGATRGEFSVDKNGAATYAIPIWVSPGIAGMEPKLSLNYSSQAGTGLAGYGWSLGGLSAISRGPQTLAVDGQVSGVSFSLNDRYYLDGQRLIAISGSDGVAGTEYRTEIDSFSKIISYGSAGNGPAYFKVWTKAGLIMEYGTASGIGSDAAFNPQARAEIMSWSVKKNSDTKGNPIRFE